MEILLSRRVRPLAVFAPAEIRCEWADQIYECQGCYCQFRMKEPDKSLIFAKIYEGDGGHVGVDDFLTYLIYCPEMCGAMIKIGSNRPTSEEYKHIVKKRA